MDSRKNSKYSATRVTIKIKLIFLVLVLMPFSISAENIFSLDLAESNWKANAFVKNNKVNICFNKNDSQKNCSEILTQNTEFLENKIIEIADLDNTKLIMLASEHSNFGSGALKILSFWQYDTKNNKILPTQKNPQIILSEQSQYKFKKGKLFTANAILGENETHFSPHFFRITTYDFIPKQGFGKTRTYITNKKYPSFDDVDTIEVLR